MNAAAALLALALLPAGCGEGDEAARDAALAPWPDDPDALLERCAREPFAELATTCRVQAAALLARRGDAGRAAATCDAVEAGTWRSECHFRVGEELGRRGDLDAALRHCREAGWFARFCLTHVGWTLPRDPAVHPGLPAGEVLAAGRALLERVDRELAGAPDGLEGEGHDILLARFGYNVYVGSGIADPAPARAATGRLAAALRTGFAIEAARLLDHPEVDDILAVWRGERPPPRGAPLPEERRVGRYVPPVPSPYEEGLARLPTYGGGMRLVSDDPEEDVAICALEAIFWLPDGDAEAAWPYVEDPRPLVRWTAAKVVGRVPTPGVEERLRRLAEEGADEGVRWHARHALEHRSWQPPPRRVKGRP